MVTAAAGWTVGIVLGVVVILVAAAILITIVDARRADRQAGEDGRGGRRGRARPDGRARRASGRINDSGVRVLHAARALRKVAVGK